MRKEMSKKGQVTIFIIIAIIIVALVAGYFLIKGKTSTPSFPVKLQPVEDYFLGCVNQKLEMGKNILSSQAGWIYPPNFAPGSEYAPFSSQLGFNGLGVPYWYYVSGNNLVEEQVPSKQQMQTQLEKYVKESWNCDFSDFEAQGYIISLELKDITVKINDLSVSADVSADLSVAKGNDSAVQSSHNTEIQSKLGRFYNDALKIYNSEKQTTFLENYSIDTLRLYAPVDGVEISCAPKTWIPEKVISDLKSALEQNIQAIKTRGDYYSNADKYFITNIETKDSVNFLYSANWTGRFEVWPVENVMVAEPVGNQQGLGILGFCYVPYHFVYDLFFPVLVQVYDSKEMFQFPVAVVIRKNQPRNSLIGESVAGRDVELCKYKNSEVSVYTYDTKLNPVAADIKFNCFDTECDIGKTEIQGNDALLIDNFPQCVNGFIVAKADGYAEKKYQISTNSETTANIILDKLYDVPLDVKINGQEVDSALIYFSGEYSGAVSWPEQKSVKLTEGFYNITLYVYRNSSLIFPASSTQKCVQVTSGGLMGLLGQTKEQCFDINLPEQQVTSVLSGGGKASDYFTEDRLEKVIKIDGESLPVPASIEALQKNYEQFETKKLTII